MKSSDRFLFRAGTLDGRIFYLMASCLGEALFKAEIYVEKQHKDDLVDEVQIAHGEMLEDEESDKDETGETEVKREKLALVIGRIEAKKAGDEEPVS